MTATDPRTRIDDLTTAHYLRAVLNILEDYSQEKKLLEESQRAVLNILDDLDAEKRRAEEASRMKSAFVANMSHELRTPLNAIMGFTKLLLHETVGPLLPRQREFLGDILRSSQHLLQLINDVLDLAKVESGRIEFNPVDVSVRAIVDEVCDVLKPNAADKLIAIQVSIEPDCDEVSLDPARLKQVLYNYLSNALKFTPNGGRVEVCVRAEGDNAIRVEVEDSGIGLAADDQAQLFTEFHQVDSGLAKRYSGTGLGLALTKRIVEAQGGHVGVESQPGVGSTFFAVMRCGASGTTERAL